MDGLTELSFRDGKRMVPDHIAVWMEGIETYRLTYEEALTEMNRKTQTDYINRVGNRFVSQHFRGFRK